MSKPVYRKRIGTSVMGTPVNIDVVMGDARIADEPMRHSADRKALPHASAELEAVVDHAFAWFYQVEECCTRFDPSSELARLSAQIGVAVPASAILFQAVQFALAVAEESGGAFDPTVGSAMETRGFQSRVSRSGRAVRIAPEPVNAATQVSSHQPSLSRCAPRSRAQDDCQHWLRPLLFDSGAVAKGLAIDMAANELRPFANFAINAGGDVYVGGHNAQGALWSVGIRHPRVPGALFETLRVSNSAVCTSGDYERRCSVEASGGVETAGDIKTEVAGHHILDPPALESQRGRLHSGPVRPPLHVRLPPQVQPGRQSAGDGHRGKRGCWRTALATAAFVLGPDERYCATRTVRRGWSHHLANVRAALDTRDAQ